MARGEKKKELSLEEKLAQALVPLEEQPYEVPGNWCWTRWGMIGEFIAGSGFKIDYQGYTEYDIPFYKVGSLKYADEFGYLYDESNTITEEIRKKLKATLIPKNAILFAKIGEAIKLNRRCLNRKNCCIDNNMMAFVVCQCDYRYVYYWTLGQYFYDLTNATTVPALRKSDLELIKFPLSPLQEQQRIVERIESLFAKLDEVKEKVQGVLDTFEDRKAAILYKAFQGELTVQWRYENNVDIDTWRVKQLDEVCKSIFDGDHMPPPKSESGIHFLVISNVNTGYLSFENTRYVPQEYYDGLTATRKPEKGDILYTLVGTYGIPIVVDSDTPFCFQRHMGLLKLDGIDTHFLWYQMQSQEFYNKATEIANGTAQLTVPIKGLRKLKVSCPSVAEQKELVQILNSLFEKENETKQLVESVLNNVSLLKKSILAKAFRGELGTNNPKEEAAIELLKTILD